MHTLTQPIVLDFHDIPSMKKLRHEIPIADSHNYRHGEIYTKNDLV